MVKGKIVFKGNFWEFFFMAIGLMILSIITFGLLLPYLFYWQLKYFFNNMEIEMYDNRASVPQAY
ncbi:hypothetical protein GCM10011316_21720 [Roseibium aquae]|uniref:Uncharacterized protein n=1 Tax=Roseibium aquae TaxID=1323746 RepID=A0A916X121_9HYPH|nr:DUF898 domain-containing protein [Roseibium aquae]GGB49247.1 hypothetical protein GCM10011316_21720 [Roseibium aquae]